MTSRYGVVMDRRRREGIGAAIREMRDEGNLSRPQLAALTASEAERALSVEMIVKVEGGLKAPSERTLDRLAAALGVETSVITTRAAAHEIQGTPHVGSLFTPRVRRAAVAGGLLTMAGFPVAGVAAAALLHSHLRDEVDRRDRQRATDDAMRDDLDDFLADATPVEREQLAALLASAARKAD
jgi:transcriptional regulator with XRE-family HTH domain